MNAEQKAQLAAIKKAKKAQRAISNEIIAKEKAAKAAALIQAQQIVPIQPPQNQQLINHVPTPNYVMMQSPAAQVAAGNYQSSPEDDLSDYADLFADLGSYEIAENPAEEAQLIVPGNLATTLAQDSMGRIIGTTIVPHQFTQGTAARVITDADYQMRKTGRSPFRFLPRTANVPYDPYLNKTLWYSIDGGRWVFEMDPTKHPDYEAVQAAERQRAGYKESISRKELEKRAIDRFGPNYKELVSKGKQRESNTVYRSSGDWSSNKRKAYVDPKLTRQEQGVQFNLPRYGQDSPTSMGPPRPRTFAAPPIPRPSQIGTIMAQVAGHNPQGLERAPLQAHSNDFPNRSARQQERERRTMANMTAEELFLWENKDSFFN